MRPGQIRKRKRNAVMPSSRIALCAIYAAIALAALIATWSQNLAYFHTPADFSGARAKVDSEGGRAGGQPVMIGLLRW